jgi:hypothetical protein
MTKFARRQFLHLATAALPAVARVAWAQMEAFLVDES